MSTTQQPQTGIAEINGTTLYYEIAGEGHPLVMNHGGLVNRRLWDDQFEVFAQHYKVIRYDFRGFGDSGLLKKGDAPYSLIDDLYALLTHLGIHKTYIMGLSMGGALSIDFTLAHPEMVDALIPVAMSLSGFTFEDEKEDEPDPAYEAFNQGNIPLAVEYTLRTWTDGPERTPEQVNPIARERVRQMTTSNFQRPDNEDVPEPVELEPPAISRLSEIHVPTLIVVGDEDVRKILTIADILMEGIAGARKVVIPGTAHHLNIEKPAEFNRLVLDFLEGL